MTLGTIFGSVLGPSSLPGTSHSHKFLSERNSAFYHHGSSKHHKANAKSDKKHAILSALTLLAFLFFLNILQNCIREQSGNGGTIMVFGPTGGTAPTGHHAKEPKGQESIAGDGPPRRKRSAEWVPKNQTGHGRKSRSLLGVEEAGGPGGWREMKFIRNFGAVNNWTRELSQMSERELEDQKLKTLNFPLYWKNNRLRATLPPRVAESPHGNKTVSHVLRRFKKRERTSSSTEPMQSENKAPAWDYKRPDRFQPSPYIPEKRNGDSQNNQTQHSDWQTRREVTPAPRLSLNAPTISNPIASHASTTPRNRRSDYSTMRPTDYDDDHDHDPYPDPTKDDLHLSPTSALGLDLNTFQTFPVYNYYNSRPTLLRENQTTDVPTPDPTSQEIDRMHNDVLKFTTQQPLFHPTKTSAPYSKPFYYKHRHRHPPHHAHHHVRNNYPSERYRYSPYRKTGVYEASHFHDHVHDDYYPPVVLAKYEVQHDEPGFDLIKFLWAMLTSFAKPLTNLVPSFAKDNREDAQCYDLLVCEAQRASRFMGPTAEALATTVGTLLTWAATEETRQIVVDAINSGRENTCQQQIRDCEERSGGKSAMTMIAQIMEMKLR